MLSYMSVYHFDEALKCADLIIDQYSKDPDFYFRKAQTICLDRSTSLNQLEEALELLETKCLGKDIKARFPKKVDKYLKLQEKIHQELESRVDE